MGKKDRKGKSSRSKRRYQKEQLIKRMKDSQKQVEGGGISILKPGVDVKVWRPKDGPHTIDIIPYLTGKQNSEGQKPGKVHYTFHYYIHKNVGANKEWYVCPSRTWGEPCPICEHRQKLVEKGADYDTKIKPLNTKERNLYNVICYDKNEEKKGIQVWDVSFHYFEKHVVALSKKPARGGKKERTIVFFDEEDGKSIMFTIEPAKGQEDYPEFIGHSFDDRDYEISKKVLDSAHCLDELVHKPSYKELKKAYYGSKNAKDDDDDNDNDNDNDDNDNNDNDNNDDDLESLLEELKECETAKELKKFCKTNDVDVVIKGKDSKAIKKAKKEIKEWLEENNSSDDDDNDNDNNDDEDNDNDNDDNDDNEDNDNDDNDDDDDDNDNNDDDDIEEMDKDELVAFAKKNKIKLSKDDKKLKEKKLRSVIEKAMKKGGGKKPKYTVDQIEEMTKKELKSLVKKEKLKIKEKVMKDIDDFQDAVIEALGLEDD